MELVLIVFDFLSTAAICLILGIYLVQNRHRDPPLEVCHKDLIKPLVSPAVIFTLIREHYYCHGENNGVIMGVALMVTLNLLAIDYFLNFKLAQETNQKEKDE